MSKEDILLEFEKAALNPGSDYSGNMYEEYVSKRAETALVKDREGLVGALRYWLDLRDDPKTMIAVSIIKELGLSELRKDLNKLLGEIEKGRVFFPYYKKNVITAINTLTDKPTI